MSETDHSRIKLRSAFQTDVGVVREHNEDSAAVDEESDFFVVADGMGGHAAGEVASAMAVDTVKEELSSARGSIEAFARDPTDQGRKGLVAILEAAVRKAHNAVYERGIREPDKQGMGTTLDVVLLAGPEAFVAHVGDSRTYLIRDGKAAQITTDHTVAEVLVIEGKLSIEEAQLSPLRTILVNAIGVAPDVGVEMAHVRLRTDDQLLLCSDGLHDYFPAEHELAEHIAGAEPKKALNEMVELAKARGGHDNITGIIVEVLDAPPDDFSASPFEVDLTQPAAADGVPEAVSRGDTLPHELVEEDDLGDANTEPVVLSPDVHADGRADEDSDLKTTIPMRPLPTAAERKKLERASTIPPEGAQNEDDAKASDQATGAEDTLPLEVTEPGGDAPEKVANGAPSNASESESSNASESESSESESSDSESSKSESSDSKSSDSKSSKSKSSDSKPSDSKPSDSKSTDSKSKSSKSKSSKSKSSKSKSSKSKSSKSKSGDSDKKNSGKMSRKKKKKAKKTDAKKTGAGAKKSSAKSTTKSSAKSTKKST